MQGRLWDRWLSAEIETACGHCGQPLRFKLDSDLTHQLLSPGAAPLIFAPHINWAEHIAPTIIDAY